MRFSCTKHCASASPLPDLAEDRVLRHPDIGEADTRVVGGHVEGPEILLDLHAGRLRRHQEAGDAARVAVIAVVRANSAQWVATCMPVVHIFSPLISQPLTLSRVAGAPGLHVGGVGAVVGLGEAEGDAVFAA